MEFTPPRPPTRKVQNAESVLHDCEAGRAYSDRLRFYRAFAYELAQNDPSKAIMCAKRVREKLGYNA